MQVWQCIDQDDSVSTSEEAGCQSSRKNLSASVHKAWLAERANTSSVNAADADNGVFGRVKVMLKAAET